MFRLFLAIKFNITLSLHQRFRSGSILDPHLIGFLDPDPGGVKSAKTAGKNRANRHKIHHKNITSVCKHI
jgi:hypothetical protein